MKAIKWKTLDDGWFTADLPFGGVLEAIEYSNNLYDVRIVYLAESKTLHSNVSKEDAIKFAEDYYKAEMEAWS